MNRKLIKNATVVNEGKRYVTDVLVVGERIEKVASDIRDNNAEVIDAEGFFLFPGIIDDQVHFRDPGLTHKGSIYSESRAAVAGGVTSYMDMPNTIPNTLTQQLLEDKYLIASRTSLANYSFFMGINQDNLEEALKTDNENVCGVTDDGLYFNNDHGILANYPEFLERLFSRSESLIALHCEDDSIIRGNFLKLSAEFGEQIPMNYHPLIRSEVACVEATARVLEISKKHNNRLHLFHVSTLAEANLLDGTSPLESKRITAEACVHHLWFSDKDYDSLGAKIKWNPAVKTEQDRVELLESVLNNRLDIIATDHAPHAWNEKEGPYSKIMSGGPSVQHSLPIMLELSSQGKISLERIVEKMCHNVSQVYKMVDRGYIREGYYADLVLIDMNMPWQATKENTLYKCNWSPFENQIFHSSVLMTFVNGHLVYDRGLFDDSKSGKRLKFLKSR